MQAIHPFHYNDLLNKCAIIHNQFKSGDDTKALKSFEKIQSNLNDALNEEMQATVFRRLWEIKDSPTYESNPSIAHWNFGKVVFWNQHTPCSATPYEKAQAMASLLEHLKKHASSYSPKQDAAVYYQSDACHRGKTPKDIPDGITEIQYSFLNLDKNGNIQFADEQADIERPVYLYHQHAKGNIGEIGILQKTHNVPPLCTLAIGGEVASEGLRNVIHSSEAKAHFLNSLESFIVEHPVQGLTLDLEPMKWEDQKHFTDFCREIYQKFPHLRIVIVAPQSKYNGMEHLDVKALSEIPTVKLDLMTYDFFGSNWSTCTSFNNPLHFDPTAPAELRELNIEFVVNFYRDKGFPLDRMRVGIPVVGRLAKKIEGGERGDGLYQPIPKNDQWAHDYYTQEQLGWLFEDNKENWRFFQHPVTKEPYAYNPVTKDWVTYQDEQSILAKKQFAKEKGLGGIFIWAADQDQQAKIMSKMISS